MPLVTVRSADRPALLLYSVLSLLAAVGLGLALSQPGELGRAIAIGAIVLGGSFAVLISLVMLRRLGTLLQQQQQMSHEIQTLQVRLDRQRDAIKRGNQAIADVKRLQQQSRSQLAQKQLNQLAQIQETVRLFGSIPTTAQVPAMGGWAASADLAGALVDEFLQRRPALVVECGSGVSTLWLALVARQHDIPTRIVALDHDPVFAAKTRATLERHGVSDLAEVRDAPLCPIEVDGEQWSWYDRAASADLADIAMLFVDGPPTKTGPLARYPALPVLQDQLAPSCSIVLDDMIRDDEQEIAARWEQTLTDFDRTDLALEKGATIFRRG